MNGVWRWIALIIAIVALVALVAFARGVPQRGEPTAPGASPSLVGWS
jgi:predicted MFS family arabinose efflux permease